MGNVSAFSLLPFHLAFLNYLATETEIAISFRSILLVISVSCIRLLCPFDRGERETDLWRCQ